MKRYLVKNVLIATEKNPSFAGEISIIYFGKGDYMVAAVGEHDKKLWRYKDLQNWLIRDFGYKRECDAKRNWTYRNTENTEFWISKVEIVEFDV